MRASPGHDRVSLARFSAAECATHFTRLTQSQLYLEGLVEASPCGVRRSSCLLLAVLRRTSRRAERSRESGNGVEGAVDPMRLGLSIREEWTAARVPAPGYRR
jgi:hypothetical protein